MCVYFELFVFLWPVQKDLYVQHALQFCNYHCCTFACWVLCIVWLWLLCWPAAGHCLCTWLYCLYQSLFQERCLFCMIWHVAYGIAWLWSLTGTSVWLVGWMHNCSYFILFFRNWAISLSLCIYLVYMRHVAFYMRIFDQNSRECRLVQTRWCEGGCSCIPCRSKV